MIPRLSPSESTPKFVQNFLEVLSKSEFSGDIHQDNGARLVTATDNSIYQVLPQAVVFPKIPGIFRLYSKLQISNVLVKVSKSLPAVEVQVPTDSR